MEIPLIGGRTTVRVVRIQDTVRRPLGAHSPFVHLLLSYLNDQGFSEAPKYLGIDDQNREILSYFPGEVPEE